MNYSNTERWHSITEMVTVLSCVRSHNIYRGLYQGEEVYIYCQPNNKPTTNEIGLLRALQGVVSVPTVLLYQETPSLPKSCTLTGEVIPPMSCMLVIEAPGLGLDEQPLRGEEALPLVVDLIKQIETLHDKGIIHAYFGIASVYVKKVHDPSQQHQIAIDGFSDSFSIDGVYPCSSAMESMKREGISIDEKQLRSLGMEGDWRGVAFLTHYLLLRESWPQAIRAYSLQGITVSNATQAREYVQRLLLQLETLKQG